MRNVVLAVLVPKLIADESGAVGSEYAITLAGVAVAIAAALSQFDLEGVFPAVVARIAGLVG